jgi:membrane glycosyltransferase
MTSAVMSKKNTGWQRHSDKQVFFTPLMLDISDGLIAEVMDDKKATHQQQKEQRKHKTKASAIRANHKLNHTTVNIAKVQPTTDREIAATKTVQEEINDKNWDDTNGQLLMIFRATVPSSYNQT